MTAGAHTRARARARAHVSSVDRFDTDTEGTHTHKRRTPLSPYCRCCPMSPFLVPRSLSVTRSPSRAELEACPLLTLRNPLAFTKKRTTDCPATTDSFLTDDDTPRTIQPRSSSIHLSDRSAEY